LLRWYAIIAVTTAIDVGVRRNADAQEETPRKENARTLEWVKIWCEDDGRNFAPFVSSTRLAIKSPAPSGRQTSSKDKLRIPSWQIVEGEVRRILKPTLARSPMDEQWTAFYWVAIIKMRWRAGHTCTVLKLPKTLPRSRCYLSSFFVPPALDTASFPVPISGEKVPLANCPEFLDFRWRCNG